MTLRRLRGETVIPVATAWSLAALGEARGRQELYTRQSPQRLKALREHALIESAVSSNRIEGVVVRQARIRPVLLGRGRLRDRDEQEIRGYRDALRRIHEDAARLAVSEETIKRLHRLTRRGAGDAGRYKAKDIDIIERSATGSERVRFRTVPASGVSAAMSELTDLWNRTLADREIPPLISLAAFNLDFLCIHPFRDGNGRVSRLLWLLQAYHLGLDVGRYISLERLVEEHKDRYYETLEESSRGWHEGTHEPWPYVNYALFILKAAYDEFEERLGKTAAPRGEKTELVAMAIDRARGPFRVADLQRACPGVSVDLIRALLKKYRAAGRVECLGRGQQARWQKTGRWELGNTSLNG